MWSDTLKGSIARSPELEPIASTDERRYSVCVGNVLPNTYDAAFWQGLPVLHAHRHGAGRKDPRLCLLVCVHAAMVVDDPLDVAICIRMHGRLEPINDWHKTAVTLDNLNLHHAARAVPRRVDDFVFGVVIARGNANVAHLRERGHHGRARIRICAPDARRLARRVERAHALVLHFGAAPIKGRPRPRNIPGWRSPLAS